MSGVEELEGEIVCVRDGFQSGFFIVVVKDIELIYRYLISFISWGFGDSGSMIGEINFRSILFEQDSFGEMVEEFNFCLNIT